MRPKARRARWSRSTATARCGRWSAARDYVSSIYNRATQANRQPGSSFKLFVYLSALEAGYRPDDMVDAPPITINGWSPRNDSAMSSRQVADAPVAFAYSINTVAARLGQQVGYAHRRRHGAALRHHHPYRHQPAMALGSSRRCG